jgi:hypothetical protein
MSLATTVTPRSRDVISHSVVESEFPDGYREIGRYISIGLAEQNQRRPLAKFSSSIRARIFL